MAKTFYNLGLIAYRKGESAAVVPFFETARNLEPNLSHYHLELANLYLKSGDKSLAQTELDLCFKFQNPQTHCQQYVDNNLAQNRPAEVGFLQKTVEEHYQK